MTEPLKNCPFCGGAPTTTERPDHIDGTQFFYAIACYCGRYYVCAHKMAIRKTPEIAKADAIAACNTRTPPPTQAQAGAVPLTHDEALDAFCHTPGIHQFVQAFVAGVRFAEHHHGIKGGQHGAE